MPITLGANIESLKAQRLLGQTTEQLARVFERLSSGQRINHASDDAAGLAISSILTAKARVFSQAIRNVNDGISISNVTEGALDALRIISERQLELAEQATNGSYSAKQRSALNAEANSLVEEFNRIVGSTKFNGIGVFDPNLTSVTIQAGIGSANSLDLGISDRIRRAIGNGTFTGVSEISSDTSQFAIATGDFNNDGNLDLITGAISTAQVNLYYGNGDGQFEAGASINISAASIATGDINGDGRLDVVVGTMYGQTLAYVQNANGSFGLSNIKTLGGDFQSLVLGDVNRDGQLDIIGADSDSHTIVLLGNGNGSFRAPITTTTGITGAGAGARVKVGDFDGDGKLDLLSTGYFEKTVMMLGNGDGTFRAALSASEGRSMDIGDVNGDGNLDFITISSNSMSTFLGNGDGTFRAPSSRATPIFGLDMVLGDVDGDGRLDIVSTHYLTSGSTQVQIGNGDGTFLSPISSQVGDSNGAMTLTLGDFNGDQRLDIAESLYFYGYNVQVLLANGGYSSNSQYLNINTQQGARDALEVVTANLNRIEAQRGAIGATNRRFSSAIATLQAQTENFFAAAGRIQDVDVAAESSQLIRKQILQDAVSAILSHTNQLAALALQLIKD